jgi:hypothetical protein
MEINFGEEEELFLYTRVNGRVARVYRNRSLKISHKGFKVLNEEDWAKDSK